MHREPSCMQSRGIRGAHTGTACARSHLHPGQPSSISDRCRHPSSAYRRCRSHSSQRRPSTSCSDGCLYAERRRVSACSIHMMVSRKVRPGCIALEVHRWSGDSADSHRKRRQRQQARRDQAAASDLNRPSAAHTPLHKFPSQRICQDMGIAEMRSDAMGDAIDAAEMHMRWRQRRCSRDAPLTPRQQSAAPECRVTKGSLTVLIRPSLTPSADRAAELEKSGDSGKGAQGQRGVRARLGSGTRSALRESVPSP
jgi:hypothetical protein